MESAASTSGFSREVAGSTNAARLGSVGASIPERLVLETEKEVALGPSEASTVLRAAASAAPSSKRLAGRLASSLRTRSRAAAGRGSGSTGS